MARLWILLLALLLGGCGWTDGSYVFVSPHQVGLSQQENTASQQVGNYPQLRNALVSLIDSGSTAGLFSLAEYPRDAVAADMEKAIDYAQHQYPLGAYAVSSIHYNIGTGLGASAMSVDIEYRSGAVALERIRTVRWISGAEEALENALDECAERLVLQVSGYQQTDFQELVQTYAQDNPDRVMETPVVTVGIYPDRGDVRVVEFRFHYTTDLEQLRTMREQVQPVFSSAALYVSGSADARTKFGQLHTFLMERDEYTFETSVTPAYGLLYQGTGDSKAFSQVYAAMCRRIGLDARCIQGTRDGESHWWNLIRLEDGWYHVDLLNGKPFHPMTDGEMSGYEWDGTRP